MTQKGTHTWDLILHYHRCPTCGYIIESREDYQYRMGQYRKRLECGRCHHRFILIKKGHMTLGPLIGEAEPVEVTWDY